VKTVAGVLLITLALATPRSVAGGTDPPIASPADLWRGYDPEALPLDVEVVRSWREGGNALEALRFTDEVAGGVKTRVFALQGAPADGKKLPGILHIHGGGQTASLDWVKFWAARGYVCVSFDFCGPRADRKEVTDWGPIAHANMAKAGGGLQLTPTPRESSWFHWAVAARRALTLLARDPRVDPERLGIFGVSVGGTLTWLVAGSDPRVKVADPIYGCGYNYDRRNARWDLLMPSEEYNSYQRTLSPEAHAPYVTCPLLFFSATNDGHGLMDRAYEALAATAGPASQVFTPRNEHHVAPGEGRDLVLWMDLHLKGGPAWPKTPGLRVLLDREGLPAAEVLPDRPDEVTGVEVFTHLGDKRPQVRFWRRAGAARDKDLWRAAVPVLDAWEDVYAFANVTYRDGVRVSTPLRHAIPAQLGKARATLSWCPGIGHGPDGLDHWYFPGSYTDPSLDWEYLDTGRDPEVGPFVTFATAHQGDPVSAQLATHIVSDPQSRGRDGLALAFHTRGAYTGDGLTVTVITDDRSLHARTFTATVRAPELGPGWREVFLPLARFADAAGAHPARWADVDKLELRAKAARRDPPRFARLRWVDPRDGPTRTQKEDRR
jgi:dienelactone hydrolase